jgi:hypothetical protein
MWFEGRTENISHTGMLFRCASPLRPNTMVELRLMLGAGTGDDHAGEVLCKGRVVRVERGRVLPGPSTLAVTIQRHRIVRSQLCPGGLARCA